MRRKRAARPRNGTPRNPVAAAARPVLETLAHTEAMKGLAPPPPIPAGPSRLPWPTSAELPAMTIEEAAQLAAMKLLTQQVRNEAQAALDAERVKLATSAVDITGDQLNRVSRYHTVSAAWDEKVTQALAREHALEDAIRAARVARWLFPDTDMRAVYRQVFGEEPPPAPVRPPDPPPVTAAAPPAPPGTLADAVTGGQLLELILARRNGDGEVKQSQQREEHHE